MSTDNPTPDDETADFDSGSGSKLDGLTEFVGLKPATPGEDLLIGVKLGDVTIVRLIAEGGMGRVYEGVQVRPHRTVAVKIMRPGLANQTLLKRFEYEAELLGRLQHPGIGQIYSAGVHSIAGVTVPYFVMEYIADAKTLTAYAEEHGLSPHERLHLFRQVCDAVTHGHQRGIIHRDLKPSNILVDTSGQPKVIDFGIAKATEADIALTTIQTDVGQLIGTFQYMSPEQFDANPNDIDIRTDVYALGVVLYELLAGQPPYDVRKKAVYEAMRIVKEEDPKPISHLNRTLRRDVAVIASKCLAKEKTRRYSSASELAGDVSRYLAGEPIHAAPPSLWDGVLRLARRHTAAAAAVTGLAVTVLVAFAGVSAFSIRAQRAKSEADAHILTATRERQSATLERQRAETEASKVRHGLYTDSLRRLATAIKGQDFAAARSLHSAALLAHEVAFGDQVPVPLALRILQQSLGTPPLVTLEGSQRQISALCFSPDNKHIATGAKDGSIIIWDRSTQSVLLAMRHVSPQSPAEAALGLGALLTDDTVVSLGYSGGKNLVSISRSGWAVRWNAATGESEEPLGLHEATRDESEFHPIPMVALSQDGTKCAWATRAGQVSIWDLVNRKRLSTIAGFGITTGDGSQLHTLINAMTFNAEATRIAICSSPMAQVYDTETGTLVCELANAGHVCRIAFMPDGLSLIGTGSTLSTWDASTGAGLSSTRLERSSVTSAPEAISPIGTRIAVPLRDDSQITLCDVTSGSPVMFLTGHNRGYRAVAFSSDGEWLALSENATTHVWSLSGDESLTSLVGHTSPLTAIAYSPDGARIATGADDGSVRVWDSATHESLALLQSDDAPVCSLAFSHDNSRILSFSMRGVSVWDAMTGQAVPYEFESARFLRLAWAADGMWLVFYAGKEAVRLTNPVSGVSVTLHPVKQQISSLDVSAEKDRVATAHPDGSVCLWDLRTGALLSRIPLGSNTVSDVALSPDGSLLGTASREGTRLTDLGTQAQTVNVSSVSSAMVGFSPSGHLLVATSDEGIPTAAWNVVNHAPVVLAEDGETEQRDRYYSRGNAKRRSEAIAQVADKAAAQLLSRAQQRPSAEDITLFKLFTEARMMQLFESSPPVVFSPDSALLAYAGKYGQTRVVDTVRGDLVVDLSEPRPATCMAYHPQSSEIAVCSMSSQRAYVYGATSDDIRRNRLAAIEACRRLAPLVDSWFDVETAIVKERLSEARATMSVEDYRAAANLVLIRATTQSGAR